jgi:hypothetical protein
MLETRGFDGTKNLELGTLNLELPFGTLRAKKRNG